MLEGGRKEGARDRERESKRDEKLAFGSTDLMSSTVSEYMVYGDLASNGSLSMALPHSMKESAPSA